MNNIAELVIRGDPTDERLAYSEDWARNALSILQTARKLAKEPISTCEHTLSAALYNAGILREVRRFMVSSRHLTNFLIVGRRSEAGCHLIHLGAGTVPDVRDRRCPSS
jgi:hypothetical protein